MSHILTPKQRRAAALLAIGNSTKAVAHHLGVRRETLSRWKKLPAFEAEIEQFHRKTRDHVRHRLTSLLYQSIRTAESTMNGHYTEDRSKMAAHVLKMFGNGAFLMPLTDK